MTLKKKKREYLVNEDQRGQSNVVEKMLDHTCNNDILIFMHPA